MKYKVGDAVYFRINHNIALPPDYTYHKGVIEKVNTVKSIRTRWQRLGWRFYRAYEPYSYKTYVIECGGKIYYADHTFEFI